MASLNHWNTVQIFDYGITDDGTLYYVMEYLRGLNLQEMIQQTGPLPPGRLVHFLRQICNALQEAHAIHLIHRDIKPSNILACKCGGACDVVKLLDFGLVRQISATHKPQAPATFGQLDVGMTIDTGREGIAGTPHYMAPEQISASHRVDERTDIYGVGALAYFLLTGKPPFIRPTLNEVLSAHLHEAVEPPGRLVEGLPADLEAVVLKCLSKDPDERFPNVGALEAALAGCGCSSDWPAESASAWWERNFKADYRDPALQSTFEGNGASARGAVTCILDSSQQSSIVG